MVQRALTERLAQLRHPRQRSTASQSTSFMRLKLNYFRVPAYLYHALSVGLIITDNPHRHRWLRDQSCSRLTEVSGMVSQAIDYLSSLDQDILQSELVITRQRMRISGIERAGNDASLSRSVLRNFETALHLKYGNRDRARHEFRSEVARFS